MSEKRLSLKELQEVELGILRSFHEFCEKNGLRYYLAGGTLIGAIRHKGFIPWDDDIDLIMPRPDYMKLVELVRQTGLIAEHHKVNCFYFDPTALSSAIRIYDTRTELLFENTRVPYKLGCWIDVFPADGLPDTAAARKRHFKWMRFVMDLYLCSITKIGGKRRSKLATVLQYGIVPFLPVIRMFKNETYVGWLDRISRKYDYDQCDWVGVLEGRAEEKEALRKAELEPAVKVEFEGEQFWAMANYHEYLTNLYGDYMQLPPESDRVSRHEIHAYWKA